ncbi:MAG TPA: hypothetical protein EYP34_06260 [Chromatiaceae bacterium]|nr:hypothetical protein [Chromatiaceae bacterium]
MDRHDFPVLTAFLEDHGIADATAWSDAIHTSEDLLDFYEQLFATLEKRMWSDGLDRALLKQYRRLMAELDQQLQRLDNDTRHHFIVVIPVADRPQHLSSCLESLLQLCQFFPYGSKADGSIGGITVLVADDSAETHNRQQNELIAKTFSANGLETLYFGQKAQLRTLDKLTNAKKDELWDVLGDIDPDHFHHKGASIMRNITYIKLAELAGEYENPLFYFIDSDQEFRVALEGNDNEEDGCAVNYFFHLDRIFSTRSVTMVTGKVVGDPPVSPAVMASNFLDDVSAFLKEMAGYEGVQECLFHEDEKQGRDGAIYHDMADLFGFKQMEMSVRYRCPLEAAHTHETCFQDFADKLKRFFHGEHPTRKTFFEFSDVSSGAAPARTVYTGNYVFDRNGLNYFIPFATLGLRMAGPTLGRILASELGDRFLTANLPMLHKRTVDETGESEFRPGIIQESSLTDLSGEFERQYFGDVMLFGMEELISVGYPRCVPKQGEILNTLQQTESRLRQKYLDKQQQIQQKLEALEMLLLDESCWWNKSAVMRGAIKHMEHFITNMRHNFGTQSRGMDCIQSTDHRQERLSQMAAAIVAYGKERSAWQQALDCV